MFIYKIRNILVQNIIYCVEIETECHFLSVEAVATSNSIQLQYYLD
jgi:hypothetical protein